MFPSGSGAGSGSGSGVGAYSQQLLGGIGMNGPTGSIHRGRGNNGRGSNGRINNGRVSGGRGLSQGGLGGTGKRPTGAAKWSSGLISMMTGDNGDDHGDDYDGGDSGDDHGYMNVTTKHSPVRSKPTSSIAHSDPPLYPPKGTFPSSFPSFSLLFNCFCFLCFVSPHCFFSLCLLFVSVRILVG